MPRGLGDASEWFVAGYECMKGPEVSYMLDPIDESSVQRFDEHGIQQ